MRNLDGGDLAGICVVSPKGNYGVMSSLVNLGPDVRSVPPRVWLRGGRSGIIVHVCCHYISTRG